MNTLLFVVLAVVALTAAAAPAEEVIPIVDYSAEGPNPDGSYSYGFQTANGINVQEEGQVVASRSAAEEGAIAVRGVYSYPGPDNKPIEVNYVADELGFRPTGNHLHLAILKSLEYQATHPEPEETQNPR